MEVGKYPTPLLGRCSFRELIKDVEITFVLNLANHARLLQQVIGDLGAYWFRMFIEHDL
jgi:hypothetical protein